MGELYQKIMNGLRTVASGVVYYSWPSMFIRWGSAYLTNRALVSARQNYNVEVEKGNTALVNAIDNNMSVDQLHELIKNGATLGNKKDEYGFALLKKSIQNGSGNMLKTILEKDLADINAKGQLQDGDLFFPNISIRDYIAIIAYESEISNSPFNKKFSTMPTNIIFAMPILFSCKNLSLEPICPKLVDQYRVAADKVMSSLFYNFSMHSMDIKVDVFLKIFINQDVVTYFGDLDKQLSKLVRDNKKEFNRYRQEFIDKMLEKNTGGFWTMLELKKDDSRCIDIFLRPATRDAINGYVTGSADLLIIELFEGVYNVALTNGDETSHPQAGEVLHTLFYQKEKIMEILERVYQRDKEHAENMQLDEDEKTSAEDFEALERDYKRMQTKLNMCEALYIKGLNSHLNEHLIPNLSNIVVEYLRSQNASPSAQLAAPKTFSNIGEATISNQ